MRVLVIGDPHARAGALPEFEALAGAVLRLCEAEPVPFDHVVVTGDVLHEHAYVHTAALNAAQEFLRKLSAVPTRGLYLLIGNHDLPSNQVFLEPRHAFNALKDWPGVTVVDTVTRAGDLWFVPYVPPGRFVEALDTAGREWREARAIFAHQELRGARNGAYVSTVGDAWAPDLPLVVCGHYHRYHWPRKNVCYVGSPAAHDFGDGEDHAVSVFTFDAHGYREERRDLGLPRRVTREVPVDEATAEMDLRAGGTDLVRLIVNGDPAALMAFRKTPVFRALQERVSKLVLRPTAAAPALSVKGGGTYLERLQRGAKAAGPLVEAALAEVMGSGTVGNPAIDGASDERERLMDFLAEALGGSP